MPSNLCVVLSFTLLAISHAQPIMFGQLYCGDSQYLSSLISTDLTVQTQPDCDDVINTICNAAVATAKAQDYRPVLTHTVNNCQGIFLHGTRGGNSLQYETCVKQFQQISVQCMLYGDAGQQYGILGISYDDTRGDLGQRWSGTPGYMMGAAGVFGDVGGRNADTIDLVDGSDRPGT